MYLLMCFYWSFYTMITKWFLSISLFFLIIPDVAGAHRLLQHAITLPGSYTAQRDVYGRFIAEASFRLYSMSPDQCVGPAYRCGGLMVSAFEADDDYWMQAYPVLSKISLSYWTKRITGKTRDYDAAYLGAGFMLWPPVLIDSLSDGGLFEPEYTCVFATDGVTGDFLYDGCGGYRNTPWPTCQALGVYHSEGYIERFGKERLNACGFTLGHSLENDRLAFNSALALQLSEVKRYGGTFYNEVLIKGWRGYHPEKIPLLGFYYIKGHRGLHPDGYRQITQKNQADFYKATHVFVPVIRVSGANWGHVRFDYILADQSPEIPDNVSVNADMKKSSLFHRH